jgi:uncharacterized membrane-anchored protein YhcB (DUF1043 family)
MDAFLSLALGIVAGLIVGLVLGLLIARGRRSSDSVDTEAISRLAAAEAQVSELRTQVESATERNSELLAQQERDAKVVAAITPLQETLRSLQAKVNEMENAAKDQSGRIVTELQETRTMGEYLRATTSSLAGALRNNKARGTWGEVQLQNLVEAAGLIGYVDFVTQKGATRASVPTWSCVFPAARLSSSTPKCHSMRLWTHKRSPRREPMPTRLNAEHSSKNTPKMCVHTSKISRARSTGRATTSRPST